MIGTHMDAKRGWKTDSGQVLWRVGRGGERGERLIKTR